MKISRDALQKHFKKPLPSVEEIADAFTFHAFEIDGIDNGTLDVKVLPNRAADCFSEEGLARELSAILDTPLTDATEPDFSGAPIVAVTLARINAILGSDFSQEEVLGVFRRLQFRIETAGDVFHITAPLPRTDITILEDVAEEVGRILGYDRVTATELPPVTGTPNQARYRGIERMKDQLIEQGFTEVSTRSFAKKGHVLLANPLDKSLPALRTSLEENLRDALARAKQYAPLVLPPGTKPKLFEVGTVFPKEGEYLELRMTERVPEWGNTAGISDNLSAAKLEEYGKDYTPVRYELGAYRPFSTYPFITRDIAMWIPIGSNTEDYEKIIGTTFKSVGDTLLEWSLLDTYEKDGKKSIAFRLIFQSMERTLTDEEVNDTMQKITAALSAKNYEVR